MSHSLIFVFIVAYWFRYVNCSLVISNLEECKCCTTPSWYKPFFTPVWKTLVLCRGNFRPSVRPSVLDFFNMVEILISNYTFSWWQTSAVYDRSCFNHINLFTYLNCHLALKSICATPSRLRLGKNHVAVMTPETYYAIHQTSVVSNAVHHHVKDSIC